MNLFVALWLYSLACMWLGIWLHSPSKKPGNQQADQRSHCRCKHHLRQRPRLRDQKTPPALRKPHR